METHQQSRAESPNEEADMPEKFLIDNYPAVTYFTVLLLAFWGGVAGYAHKVKTGITKRFSISELVGELVISGFVGIITFYLCEYAHFPQPLTGACVGIAGHMGSRFIFLVEKNILNKLEKNL